MKINEFKNFVRSIISESKKKKSDEDSEKKEKTAIAKDYLDQETSKYRKDIDNEPSENIHKLLASIRAVVNKIGKKIEVFKDDHNDIMVRQAGIFYIRINPKWFGSFDVEAYRNLSDRIIAVGLNYTQLINFIKVNFSDKKASYVQTAYNKSKENLEDRSVKKAKELPKTEPVKNKEVPAKEKEDAVTDKDDEPNAPMAAVEEKDIKRQEDYGVEKNKRMAPMQKMIKKENG